MSDRKKIYVIAGEASGDEHLASLLRELGVRGDCYEVRGLAGPETATLLQGRSFSQVEDWIEDAAVVGLAEVLRQYHWFKAKFDACLREVRAWQPDLVLLVDYPGFNLRFAKAIRHESVPTKIAYYISPQVWAWNRRRIPQMARLLDCMLCLFPFEEALYEESGLATTFVGHPLVDELASRRAEPPEREDALVALLPGSRGREVQRLFPLMLRAAVELQESLSGHEPPLRFAAAARSERLAAAMRAEATRFPELDVEIGVGRARELMQTATCGVVASGTATLEAACLGLPYCLVYQVAWPTYLVGRMLIKVDFLGMVNVMARREVVKEYLQADATPEAIAAELQNLLDSPEKREALQEDLAEITARLGTGGAAGRAAREIQRLIDHPAST